MKVLVTGAAGFVGSTVVRGLLKQRSDLEIVGLDNFYRAGSECNRATYRKLGVELLHGDIRMASDLEQVPDVDWVIDAAALPSVLAGVDGQQSSRQLVEHNLLGTVNLLELCRRQDAGFLLLSTSRVYSIEDLSSVELEVRDGAFVPDAKQTFPAGITSNGVSEECSTRPPVSLYGATKVASERLALEYGDAFGFPVWINRCGVLAGAGQFGRAEQGIFSYWLHSWRAKAALRYIGFGGEGHQVRDCLHPGDLVPLLLQQMQTGCQKQRPRVVNLSGGISNSMSLRQLSEWCRERFGDHPVCREASERPYDLPWVILDASLAEQVWDWRPTTPLETLLEEIAEHAESHPCWLETSS